MENNPQSSEPVLQVKPVAETVSTRVKLDSFGTLFKSSWQFYKSNFKQIFSFFFWLGFLPALIQLLSQFLGFKLSVAIDSRVVTILIIVLMGLVGFAVNIAIQVLYLGSVKKLNDINNGIKNTVLSSYKGILKFTVPVIFTSVIVFALIIGGGAVLLVPGILFAISSSFVGAMLLVENKKGVDALVSSFWYAHERRGQIFGRSILMVLCAMGFALLIFVVLASIAIILAFAIFGGIDQAISVSTMFLLANTSPVALPSPAFFAFLLIWSAVASVISALIGGLFSVFSFKMWQNAKSITPSEIPVDYNDKTRKQIKKWAWIGVVVIILLIIAQAFSIYYQCKYVHCPL